MNKKNNFLFWWANFALFLSLAALFMNVAAGNFGWAIIMLICIVSNISVAFKSL
jgi:hypothetical protein